MKLMQTIMSILNIWGKEENAKEEFAERNERRELSAKVIQGFDELNRRLSTGEQIQNAIRGQR